MLSLYTETEEKVREIIIKRQEIGIWHINLCTCIYVYLFPMQFNRTSAQVNTIYQIPKK